MRFLVDECLSPSYVRELQRAGFPDAIHPFYVGMRGVRDEAIAARAFAEDRIVITGNARDFRRILATMMVHPGAIFVESLNRDRTWSLINVALTFLHTQTDPGGYMINRVLEVSVGGSMRPYVLPNRTDT